MSGPQDKVVHMDETYVPLAGVQRLLFPDYFEHRLSVFHQEPGEL
jgi:hypothetical protein